MSGIRYYYEIAEDIKHARTLADAEELTYELILSISTTLINHDIFTMSAWAHINTVKTISARLFYAKGCY